MTDQSDDRRQSDDLRVEDQSEEQRYLAWVGDDLVAYSEYETEPERIVFTHTVVRPEFEGRGIGSRLAKHVVDDARNRGLRIVPICPFIRSYLRRHREYDEIVDYPDLRKADSA